MTSKNVRHKSILARTPRIVRGPRRCISTQLDTTNLRQFTKFHQNRSTIHRFIAFSRNSIRPMSAISEYCFDIADRTHWRLDVLNAQSSRVGNEYRLWLAMYKAGMCDAARCAQGIKVCLKILPRFNIWAVKYCNFNNLLIWLKSAYSRQKFLWGFGGLDMLNTHK